MPAYRKVSLRVADLSVKKEELNKKSFSDLTVFYNHNVVGFCRETDLFASFSSMVKTTFLGKD